MIRMLQEGPGVILKEKTAATAAAAAAAASGTPGSKSDALPVVAAPTDHVEGEDVFDLLIIGGGATGAGCAVDAATRGLKVAMVERDDFSSGKLLFSLAIFSVCMLF
jgi:glycerol-3-phosphate dehydrogenase